jgi:NOL1/NOP2/fmu family ribosome biogenesis protein
MVLEHYLKSARIAHSVVLDLFLSISSCIGKVRFSRASVGLALISRGGFSLTVQCLLGAGPPVVSERGTLAQIRIVIL